MLRDWRLSCLVAVVCSGDAAGGETKRLSVGVGGAESNLSSDRPAVSKDGRFVAFQSSATNLVPDDFNEQPDVFVHDRLLGATRRVSIRSDGGEGPFSATNIAISAEGRVVAFQSNSPLVEGDTNGQTDIFVHDLATEVTSRISVGPGGLQLTRPSERPAVSADGRFIAYESGAAGLVPGDTNNATDIFVHDRDTGQTTRVSVGAGGAQANGFSAQPTISADGRFVAFQSRAPNLAPEDTNGGDDIFLHDRATGVTARVSLGTGGVQANGFCYSPSISPDGRFIVYSSVASNLVPADNNGRADVFLLDRATGATERVSLGRHGEADGDSSNPDVSADGRFVAFASAGSDLIAGDTNGLADVFIHDRLAGRTVRVSVSTFGEEGADVSGGPVLSDDGRTVVFHSAAHNLIEDDSNGQPDVFVHELGGACEGDLDADGHVGPADLALLLGAWGRTGPGDLSADGEVNAADLAFLMGQWGTCAGPDFGVEL